MMIIKNLPRNRSVNCSRSTAILVILHPMILDVLYDMPEFIAT